MCDQDVISSNYIYTNSSKQVMRRKKKNQQGDH